MPGDQYSYVVSFDAKGVGDIHASTDAVRRFSQTVDASAASGPRLSSALGRVGPAMLQFSQLAEDAQFGVRGLANNIPTLIAALGGFSPVAQLAAAASSFLVYAFRDQIEAGLEWAGILDENLVKARNKEKALGDLSDATDVNTTATERNTRAQAEQTAAFLSSADAATSAARQAAQDIAGEFGGQNIRNAIVKSLEAGYTEAGRALTEFNKAQIARQADAIVAGLQSNSQVVRGWAQNELEALAQVYDEVFDKFGIAFKDLFAQLNAPGAIGAPDLVSDMQKAADAAEAARKHAKEAEQAQEDRKKAIRDEYLAFADAMKAEVDAVKEAEDEKARVREEAGRERREAESRAKLDEQTRRVVEAFGPMLQQGIQQALQRGVAGGMSPEQAAIAARAQAGGVLERAGVAGGVAGNAADFLVGQQSGGIQAAVDASNAGAAMMRQTLSGWDLMLQLMERDRAERIQGQRQAEMLRRRTEAQTRAMAPLRFMGGNPLGGFF